MSLRSEYLVDNITKMLHRYFNTVGTKEGWTPSTFVSSRKNRATAANKDGREQRAEDFMDEEDLQEAEESRQLQTSESFSGFGTADDGSRRDAFMNVFHPTGETVGTQLLRRMGWKEGQEIGQRAQRNVKRDAGNDGDIVKSTTTELSPELSTRKSDRKGLGFEASLSSDKFALDVTPQAKSERRLGHEADGESLTSSDRRSGIMAPHRKAAFGLGILNDDGSDNEDPNSVGPNISYNRVIGGDKRIKKKANVVASTPNPSVKTKPILLSKKLSSLYGGSRKCHDGKLPLDGFTLGDDMTAMASLSLGNDQYRPPEVPSGWKSSLIENDEDAGDSEHMSVSDVAKTSRLDYKSRAAVLGEGQLPGKSVFDFISPATRDRLANASGKSDLPPGLGEDPGTVPGSPPESYKQRLQSAVPNLDQETASQALTRGRSGWLPYAEDEAKRGRYTTFLEIRAGLRPTAEGDELPPRAAHMGQEDWIVEMQEFARATQVFKPVSGLMASRFTSSSSSLPAKTAGNGPASTDDLLTKPRTKPEDPADAAAKMGMFGSMTRSVFSFYPSRLLCKRFNVSMPEHTNRPPQPSQMPPASALGMPNSSVSQSSRVSNGSPKPRSEYLPVAAAPTPGQAEITSSDPDRNEALEQPRPDQALFKAVFGSEDEDEDL